MSRVLAQVLSANAEVTQSYGVVSQAGVQVEAPLVADRLYIILGEH
jgi:hypothetical protein